MLADIPLTERTSCAYVIYNGKETDVNFFPVATYVMVYELTLILFYELRQYVTSNVFHICKHTRII